MRKYNMLILTDHSKHSLENALYPIARTLARHPFCNRIDVASRGLEENLDFFQGKDVKHVFTTTVNEYFSYTKEGDYLTKNAIKTNLKEYDVIFLRLPPPLSEAFLLFLNKIFSNKTIINNPMGIFETGSKEYLLNFPELCPPLKRCDSLEAIIEFKNQFPIVLKPYREYAGRGIIRIDEDKVWIEKNQISFDNFSTGIKDKKIEYLGVKFLKNVRQGDKRIVVVGGKIMGASLRLPAKDSWICNVAQGGTAQLSKADPEEQKIVATLNPHLEKKGILFYGVDTLVNDDGRRVLSELNVTSIGGLPQMAAYSGLPLVEEASNILWNYINKHING